MELKIGDQAPLFTLFDTEKNEVSLNDYKGQKLVLLFFPLAFTSVCTKELCMIRDDKSVYDGLEATVFGISVDTIFTLGKFKEEQGFNFTLLSDFNKDVSRSYGALYENFVMDMKGVSKRSAFVIDSKGIVQYAEVLESAGDLPNFEAIKTVLSTI